MAPGLRSDRPSAASRFGWHPEPGLIGVDDEAASRPALDELGRAAWATGLAYLFDEAARRSSGSPTDYVALRRTFYGTDTSDARTGPGPAPIKPTPSADLLAEFTTRLAPHNLNSWHPRSLSYFTPPPLTMSIVGELLTQFTNQGVDVWHAGPIAAFVEEEVGRWLCDLVGYGPDSFGILTSGGVMANLMAMTIARDVGLRRILGLDRPPRGHRLDGVRAYASDQTHFSIARALDELGFPPDTLHLVPADERFRLRGAPVAEAIAEDRAAGLVPWAISAVAGSTNTGSVDLTEELAELAEREGLWLHVDAAYGGGALLSSRDRRVSQAWTGQTASRSIRTSGSSRPTTSAGCSSGGATTSSTSTTTAPSTTAAARRPPPTVPTKPTRPSSSTTTSARSKAPAAGGR